MQRDPITNCPDDLSVMPKLFVSDYFLTPGECNPEQRMPLTLLINRLIEVATLHANELGIGYAYLHLGAFACGSGDEALSRCE